MVKITDIDIQKTSEVFRPGETVCGRVTLTVDGNLMASGVAISCLGMALTKWRACGQRPLEPDLMSKEIYIKETIDKRVKNLSTGQHEFYFNFQLPGEGLPSSYEGPYGCIRYFLKVTVNKPFYVADHSFYNSFTVLAHLDGNLPEYMRPLSADVEKVISKVLVFGNVGTVYLSASIDKTGYCPGEKILINLRARNVSTKDCGPVSVSLVQNVYFTAGRSNSLFSFTDNKHHTATIKTLVDTPLEKGATRIWHQQALVIDPVPPSHKEFTCNIIKVTYNLQVSIKVPMAADLEINFPLTICTVPPGVSVATSPTLAPTGVYKIPGSKSVNYKPCTMGFQRFSNSDVYLVNAGFIPLTAFVAEETSASDVAQTSHTAGVASNLSPSAPPFPREHGPVAGHPPVICDESPVLPTYEESMQAA